MTDEVKQFGRVCYLIVGKDGDGLKIQNLRMTFDIRKSSGDNPNTAVIQIYNLNPEHQTQVIEEWADIQLFAGYEGYERLIFNGQIRTAIPKVSGTDRIITIESGDGDREILRGFVNKTLEKGCSANDIVLECQKSMFDISTAHKDELDTSYSRGKTISGRASDVLNEQCLFSDAQWSIQDGQFLFLQGDSVRPNAAWLISSETGMLGSPEPTTAGVKVRTLLNPAYLIGGVAKIESLIFTGGVRIETISHRGDNMFGEWVSEIEGLSV